MASQLFEAGSRRDLSLDTWDEADQLYLVRDEDVSPSRPFFTGDVLEQVAIPGVQDSDAAIIIAHPCAMRGRAAQLLDRILVASVRHHDPMPAAKWTEGFYDRMPLPECRGPGTDFMVAHLDDIGKAKRDDICSTKRLACMSPVGVNMLQQRLVHHLTRVEVRTSTIWEAFAHTYEEADLLEEWTEDMAALMGPIDAASEFDIWIRLESRQQRLRDPQHRASIRSELRAEVRRRRST